MKGWNNKKLQELKRSGKIRGFDYKSEPGNGSRARPINLPKPKPEALGWLEMNLQKWCNDHACELKMEHQVCKDRKWRFDFAMPAHKIAVEYEGGIYLQRSGHNTPKHYTKDTEKYNRAQAEGWRVIRVTHMNYKQIHEHLNAFFK
jgi:very-short-patch-repair endonuclease